MTDPSLSVRELSGWWPRAAAFVLDAMIVGVAFVLIDQLVSLNTYWSIIVNLASGAAYVAYGAVFIGISGQTVGMRVLSIRVMDADKYLPIDVKRAWMRSIVAYALYLFPGELLFLVEKNKHNNWSSHHHLVVTVATAIGMGLWLTLLLPVWDTHKQTLHDKAVHTVVVQTYRPHA